MRQRYVLFIGFNSSLDEFMGFVLARSARVILRWLIQRRVVVIPKSVRKERMAENFNVFGFALDAQNNHAARAEYFADATDDASQAIEWTMPKGRFVDAFPVLVISIAGLRSGPAAYPAGDWDVRRFRRYLDPA